MKDISQINGLLLGPDTLGICLYCLNGDRVPNTLVTLSQVDLYESVKVNDPMTETVSWAGLQSDATNLLR